MEKQLTTEQEVCSELQSTSAIEKEGSALARADRSGGSGVCLAGIPFADVTEDDLVSRVMSALDSGRGGWIVTPNLDILRQLVRDEGSRRIVEDASLMIADGMPLVWASRLRGTPVPERVAGSVLISSLCRAAAEDGRSVFLLGGDEGTAELAAKRLQARCPGLGVTGTYCPPVGFEKDQAEMERVTRAVCEVQPDIVFVGLGFPKQERLIRKLRPYLPQAWYMGVGISFSYLSGRVKHAPVWMRRVGLEWAFRLAQEPRRLFKRYIVRGVPFAMWLFAHVLWQRYRRGRE